MAELSRVESDVLEFIQGVIRGSGKPPTRGDIADRFEFSRSRVQLILETLKRKKQIELDGRCSWMTLPGWKLKKAA